jgi:hypothetical protein
MARVSPFGQHDLFYTSIPETAAGLYCKSVHVTGRVGLAVAVDRNATPPAMILIQQYVLRMYPA